MWLAMQPMIYGFDSVQDIPSVNGTHKRLIAEINKCYERAWSRVLGANGKFSKGTFNIERARKLSILLACVASQPVYAYTPEMTHQFRMVNIFNQVWRDSKFSNTMATSITQSAMHQSYTEREG